MQIPARVKARDLCPFVVWGCSSLSKGSGFQHSTWLQGTMWGTVSGSGLFCSLLAYWRACWELPGIPANHVTDVAAAAAITRGHKS
jgi:hypothetical protein